MDSLTIYKDEDYEITNHLFIYGDMIYSLKHLTSVKLEKTEKKFPFAIVSLSLLIIVVGLLLNAEFALLLAVLGVLGVIGSFLAYFLSKPVHKLYLVFSSGEKEVLEDVDYKNLVVIAEAFSLAITSGIRDTN